MRDSSVRRDPGIMAGTMLRSETGKNGVFSFAAITMAVLEGGDERGRATEYE